MPVEDTLLAALAIDPADDVAWLVLADCLEEQGRFAEAELTRLREELRRTAPTHSLRRKRERRLHALLAQGVLPVMPRYSVPLAANLSLDFVLIPPGSFRLGSPSSEKGRFTNESPLHRVHLTHGFWLGQTTVTQTQWELLTSANPSPQTLDHRPATQISFRDCKLVCQQLSRRTGRFFRLPTEAEWEYACRATTLTPFHSGISEKAAHQVGWHHTDNADGHPQPVGQKLPNAWGLYDMHGNVWEWCLDALRSYSSHEVTDPTHDLRGRTPRVLRGGSFCNSFREGRASCRGWARHQEHADHWGCRLAISMDKNDPFYRAFAPRSR
jgi:uncharacterized protein (TIGR02996 family)